MIDKLRTPQILSGKRSVLATAVTATCVFSSIAAAQIPPPFSIPGKEYSNRFDEDAFGGIDHLQIIAWDGFGNALDSFDYSGSARPPWGAPIDPDQIDALAHFQDFLFNPVRMGAVPFVVSFGGIGDIYSHDTTGATGLWASGPVDINTVAPPDDLDALEVWGPKDQDDADRFSIEVDWAGPGIAVFKYDAPNHNSSQYIFHHEVDTALGVPDHPQDQPSDLHTDIDALMVNDVNQIGVWDSGDSIIFSLWPNAALGFDGGEIWVWDNGAAPQFLVHGGRVWDTLNPVGAIFGVNTENINAFEAIIPAPGALTLLGLAGLLARRRRRR